MTNSPKVLLLDMDGTLANFTEPFADVVRFVTGKDIPLPATSWDWFRERLGGPLTDEESQAVWDWIEARPHWWYDLPSLPGADWLLKTLIGETDHVVYFSTARDIGAKHYTEMWLNERGVEAPTVCVTQDRGKLADALAITHAINDCPTDCTSIHHHTKGQCRTALLARSHNTRGQELFREVWGSVDGGIQVVDSLEEWAANEQLLPLLDLEVL